MDIARCPYLEAVFHCPVHPLYLLVGCSCRGAGYVEDCYLSHQHCRRHLGYSGETMMVALVLTLTSQLTRQYLPCSIARESLEHGRWLWLLLQWDSQVHPFLFIGHPRHVHQGIFGRDRLPVVPSFRVWLLYLSLHYILLPPRPTPGHLEDGQCWLCDLIGLVPLGL